jgi:2-polyprenyl-6-hydroxyphenyl methylase/3-demethylubiquinone-9 3-methyltransferase
VIERGRGPSDAPLRERHAQEVAAGERFPFGENWRSFLETLSEERIDAAARAIAHMLGEQRLVGRSVLDAGSGSGLSSLAALRLGAVRVHSFDYDPASVACTAELKRRYAADAAHWTIEQGSVLDRSYLERLGTFDLVYSWGVLHHTGALWDALDAITGSVAPDGRLFVAIYNDQGGASRRWRAVKQIYCGSTAGRLAMIATFFPYFALGGLVADVRARRSPLRRYHGQLERGMSVIHDWHDWLGGYPFEVAKPEQVLDFCRQRGFVLERLKTCGGGLGCNEFVFRRA